VHGQCTPPVTFALSGRGEMRFFISQKHRRLNFAGSVALGVFFVAGLELPTAGRTKGCFGGTTQEALGIQGSLGQLEACTCVLL